MCRRGTNKLFSILGVDVLIGYQGVTKMLATKKPRLDNESDGGNATSKTNQLIDRKWVKVGDSEKEKPGQQLLKVMQWNSLADGKSLAWLLYICMLVY